MNLVFLPLPELLYVMEICGRICVPFWCLVWLCVYLCMCPSFAQMWKTLFVRHLETQRGRLYKIPACWSNGTVGKATIVVPTMKRLSSVALREKCTQFVFCPSLFITLAVTFPCVPINSSPLPSRFGLPSAALLSSHPTFFSLHLSRSHPHLLLSQPFSLSLFFIQLKKKLYSINYMPQDLPHHKSQVNRLCRNDNDCITSYADVIIFQPAILWQCWHSP